MKIYLLTLIILFLGLSIFGQAKKIIVKPTPTPVKKVNAITSQEATTTDGKRFKLKSNKTWEYANKVSNYKKSEFSNIPFDTLLTKLPKGFLGHSFPNLFNRPLAKLSFDSLEFKVVDA